MPHTDLPLAELRDCRGDVTEPDDFDPFWEQSLDQARQLAGEVTTAAAATPLTSLTVDDVTFGGFGGEPVRAWVIRSSDRPAPTVVEFVGYGGGRGNPAEHLRWASAGFTHVVMDVRGQGSAWGSGGDTPDPHGSAAAFPGFMTRGIEDPATYYYRRLIVDAVRLLDQLGTLPGVDPDRIAVTGVSQGGGIALAAAALSPTVRAVLPDVPFLCHFRRSVELATTTPYNEVARYLAVHRDRTDAVFRTLSYVDAVSFARRITVPALFSVGLMDDVVLPSTVFAAFNALAATDRRIEVYGFNGHDGGGVAHWQIQVDWLTERI
ncbi:hypothetical protein LUZ63_021694 [Rhynchospora breviuscula]|uniref:Acetyl xylan esterase domain-containing protein n=1 Tax=Rhynchospora breviuscula TaxID=2022672 RepID=A0A9P9Z655_9POAL|nr:hypothetical protein LUZ63_021694 [Rhynchospora breviuscula]